jgi:hypothetical protein
LSDGFFARIELMAPGPAGARIMSTLPLRIASARAEVSRMYWISNFGTTGGPAKYLSFAPRRTVLEVRLLIWYGPVPIGSSA